MSTRGRLGEVPDWYVILKAAKYLGCAPWELEQAPIAWLFRALAAMEADSLADQYEVPRE